MPQEFYELINEKLEYAHTLKDGESPENDDVYSEILNESGKERATGIRERFASFGEKKISKESQPTIVVEKEGEEKGKKKGEEKGEEKGENKGEERAKQPNVPLQKTKSFITSSGQKIPVHLPTNKYVRLWAAANSVKQKKVMRM